MSSLLHQAPGLSVLADVPTLQTAGELGGSRYRRWLERRVLEHAAGRASRTPAVRLYRAGHRPRIRLTSPVSGTLPRLP